MSLTAMISDSPSTKLKLRFRLCGTRALEVAVDEHLFHLLHAGEQLVAHRADASRARPPFPASPGGRPRPCRRSGARPACPSENRARGRRRASALPAARAACGARTARRCPSGRRSCAPRSDIRSTFSACRSMSHLPVACAESTWNRMPRLRHSSPIAGMSWMTPISLFTYITDTRIVSLRSAALELVQVEQAVRLHFEVGHLEAAPLELAHACPASPCARS